MTAGAIGIIMGGGATGATGYPAEAAYTEAGYAPVPALGSA